MHESSAFVKGVGVFKCLKLEIKSKSGIDYPLGEFIHTHLSFFVDKHELGLKNLGEAQHRTIGFKPVFN